MIHLIQLVLLPMHGFLNKELKIVTGRASLMRISIEA